MPDEENRKLPTMRCSAELPVRMMALTSFRYWGLTKAINRYLDMVRAEREATDARVDLEVARDRLRHLDQILAAERLKIEGKLAAQELASRIAEFKRESSLAQAELAAERDKRLLKEYKENAGASKNDGIEKLAAFRRRREELYEYLDTTKRELISARGGEENLTERDKEMLEDMEENLRAELILAEDNRG